MEGKGRGNMDEKQMGDKHREWQREADRDGG